MIIIIRESIIMCIEAHKIYEVGCIKGGREKNETGEWNKEFQFCL